MDAHDLWVIPLELEKYLGWWGWEVKLNAKDRYRLAFTRSLAAPEDGDDFALAYALTVESSEYQSALDEAETPEERAVVKLEGELDSYPYRVSWDARTPEEMELVTGYRLRGGGR